MDNKKWYKRISTCFWFLLATMMFWLPLVMVVFSYFIHSENITSLNNVSLDDAYIYGLKVLDNMIPRLFTGRFGSMPLPFIYTMFINLFTSLGFSLSSTYNLWSCVALSWFATVYFFELMVDFIVWLPRWCHNILSKGVDKVD